MLGIEAGDLRLSEALGAAPSRSPSVSPSAISGRCRFGALLVTASVLALHLAGAAAASAQRLWSIEEVSPRPTPAPPMDGVGSIPTAAGVAGSVVKTASVNVEFDYLRLGFGHLELPLPDGSVVEADNTVFEDRGGGNLLWTGEVAGAGYESVLLTVQDGFLIGQFGEPGGPRYAVHAEPNGRGSLAVDVGPVGDWCGVKPASLNVQGRGGSSVADALESSALESNHNRLEILALYPERTVQHLRGVGGPTVLIQHSSDYLNMVFRNGAVPVTVNVTPVEWQPEMFNHPIEDGFHSKPPSPQYYWAYWGVRASPEVYRFVRQHGADLVHFFPAYLGPFGFAELRIDSYPSVFFGVSGALLRSFAGGVGTAQIFAHEVGHNLGGGHDPPSAYLPPSGYIRPYAFGHTDLTSCTRNTTTGDLDCPYTVMSYATEAALDSNPRTVGRNVPFFSSVRHRPNGWTLGIAGERENERVVQETIHVAVRGSEALVDLESYPRGITAIWTGRDTVRLTSVLSHKLQRSAS